MRRTLDPLAWDAVPEGKERGRSEIGETICAHGGSLSAVLERMVSRGYFTVRRQEKAARDAPAVFYRRADGAVFPVQKVRRPKPKRASPLPVVLARISRRAEPLPPLRRVSSVFDLGAM